MLKPIDLTMLDSGQAQVNVSPEKLYRSIYSQSWNYIYNTFRLNYKDEYDLSQLLYSQTMPNFLLLKMTLKYSCNV